MNALLTLLLFAWIHSTAGAQETQLTGKQIATAAREQIGVTTEYDPAYSKLQYPAGDVPANKGVCSDVVVRAVRKAGLDLQKEVHEDMQTNFTAYPQKWGLK